MGVLLSGPRGGGADDGGGSGGGGMVDEEACQYGAGLRGEVSVVNEGHVEVGINYASGGGAEEGWKGTGTKGVYNDGDCGMARSVVGNMRRPRGTGFHETAMGTPHGMIAM